MALLKLKKLLEDVYLGTQQVIDPTQISIGVATSAAYAGTSEVATLATSAGRAGTALVAHYASSGTGKLAGTHALYSSGAQGL